MWKFGQFKTNALPLRQGLEAWPVVARLPRVGINLDGVEVFGQIPSGDFLTRVVRNGQKAGRQGPVIELREPAYLGDDFSA